MAAINLTPTDRDEFFTIDTDDVQSVEYANDAQLAALGCSQATAIDLGGGDIRFCLERPNVVLAMVEAADAAPAASSVLGVGIFDGDDGSLAFASGILTAAVGVKNATGDYTITPDSPFPTGAAVIACVNSGAAEIATPDGPAGATVDVKTFDAAGAAADVGFVLVCFGGVV